MTKRQWVANDNMDNDKREIDGRGLGSARQHGKVISTRKNRT